MNTKNVPEVQIKPKESNHFMFTSRNKFYEDQGHKNQSHQQYKNKSLVFPVLAGSLLALSLFTKNKLEEETKIKTSTKIK